jgi:hypothetical protein
MGIVIGLNCLLAMLIFGLVRLFWQWRCALAKLNDQLHCHEANYHGANRHQTNAPQASLSPQQMGYALTRRRTQIAETRLMVARWQVRSRQLKQTWQLIQILRNVLLYRTGFTGLPGQRRVRRRSK